MASAHDLPTTDELLKDQRGRWRRGERVPVEDIVRERPALLDQTEALLDLIYAEVVLRREAGERPDMDEYLDRFPTLADPLRIQFEVDAAIDGPTRLTIDNNQDFALTRPAADASLPPPVAPPGYEILGELGRGGMGVVYKARQVGLDRLVALKMIRSGALADPAERARFDVEARAVARLSHPNVVQVYEVGEADGQPFLALEYVPGGNLADVVRDPLPPRPAAELVATLARAIEHAHSQGVVHRDLKPANVLLVNDECRMTNDENNESSSFVIRHSSFQPKVVDFGLAKRLDADGLTRTGDFVGTPNFTAPEQAAGRSDVGPPADVYGLAAILYHLLTGRPPFAGAGVLETLDQVRFADPVPPSKLRPNLPADLETICLHGLHKEPARRYPSAAALADDLERFLDGRPIVARPVGTTERVAKWCRRRPAVAGLVGALAVLIPAALVTSTVLWQRAAAARDAEANARIKEGNARVQEANARQDERAQRQRAEARSAELLIANARYAWMTDDLDAARIALSEVDLPYRNADWAYLNRACHAARLAIPSVGGGVIHLTYRPDGKLFAGATIHGWVRVWDADTGEERLVVQAITTGLIASVAFLANDRLAVASQGYVAKGTTGRTESEVKLYDIGTGQMVKRWFRQERGHFFTLSPDGRWAAFVATGSRDALLLEAETGELVHRLTASKEVMIGVSFSADGALVATQGQLKDLRVWDTATGQEVRKFTPPPSALGLSRTLTLSADGRLVALGVHQPGKRPMLIALEADREVFRTDVPIPLLVGVAASRDGKLLAGYGQNEIALPVWEADTGRERIVLRGYRSPVNSLAFRPDGREVVAGYMDGG